jgi:hypothetical protein
LLQGVHTWSKICRGVRRIVVRQDEDLQTNVVHMLHSFVFLAVTFVVHTAQSRDVANMMMKTNVKQRFFEESPQRLALHGRMTTKTSRIKVLKKKFSKKKIKRQRLLPITRLTNLNLNRSYFLYWLV